MKLASRLSTLKKQAGAVTGANSTALKANVKPSEPNKKKNNWGKDKHFAERAGGRVIAPGLIKIDRRLSLTCTHGSVVLSGIRQRVAFSVAHQDVQAEDYLFFDTETTGLAGGTGT